jgi:aminoglycoside 6'-N-acetyltransferase I
VTGFAEYRPGAGRPRVAVRVRPATSSDVEELVRIQNAAGRTVRQAHYERAVDDPEVCVVVAEASSGAGTVVTGWAQTSYLDEVKDLAPVGHYLGGVTVDPTWRRRGVAIELTDARMRWIAARADEAFYVVNATNRASIDLHRRWGFLELARGPRFAGTPFEGGLGILMRADVVALRR